MNIYEKLSEARIKLQSLELKKSGVNDFAKFKYFELSDFLPTLNKIFKEEKLFPIISIENGDTASMTILNSENPEEKITFKCPFIPTPPRGGNEMQAVGAAMTYVRRYLYMLALEIVEDDTLDAVIKPAKKNSTKNSNCEVEEIYTIDELNQKFDQFQTYPPRNSDWKRILWEKAKKMGCIFSKEMNCFVMA